MPPPGSGSGWNGARPALPAWLVLCPAGSSTGKLGPCSPVTSPMPATAPARSVLPQPAPPVTCASASIEIVLIAMRNVDCTADASAQLRAVAEPVIVRPSLRVCDQLRTALKVHVEKVDCFLDP